MYVCIWSVLHKLPCFLVHSPGRVAQWASTCLRNRRPGFESRQDNRVLGVNKWAVVCGASSVIQVKYYSSKNIFRKIDAKNCEFGRCLTYPASYLTANWYTWDRFDKTLLPPKSFWIKFRLKYWTNFHIYVASKSHIYTFLWVLWCIIIDLRYFEAPWGHNYMTKLGFIRKFRPKRFRKIGPCAAFSTFSPCRMTAWHLKSQLVMLAICSPSSEGSFLNGGLAEKGLGCRRQRRIL
jgi:hypothetical protein